MNDEKFDKILGSKLNTADIDFSFTENHWNKMENQILVAEADRKRRRLLGWLSLLLLPLFALLGWNSWTLHKAENTIDDLVQEVKALQQEKQTPSVATTSISHLTSQNNQITTKSDTVYHHVVVKRYDTIFQTVIQRVLSNAASLQDEKLTIKTSKVDTTVSKSVFIPKTQTNSLVTSNKTDKNTQIPPTDIADETNDTPKNDISTAIEKRDSIEKQAIKDSLKTTIAQSKDSSNAIVAKKTNEGTTTHPLSINDEKQEKFTEKALEKQKTKRPPIIKPIKITGYQIGISGGWAVIDGKNILRQDGYSIGGQGSILLSERLKMVGEAQYVDLSYELDKIPSNRDIPIVAPPSPDAVFTEVLVKQPYFHYALGLQYALTRTRLQPFIGTSIFGQTKLEEKFDYKFKNKIRGDDIFVSTKRDQGAFQAPFLRLNLGAEYPIFNKFKAQLTGSYDIELGKNPQFQPLYQLKGAVLYRF